MIVEMIVINKRETVEEIHAAVFNKLPFKETPHNTISQASLVFSSLLLNSTLLVFANVRLNSAFLDVAKTKSKTRREAKAFNGSDFFDIF